MVNKNIIKIRKKLDILDNSLLDIIKKRTKLVDEVLKKKKIKKKNRKKKKNKKNLKKKIKKKKKKKN